MILTIEDSHGLNGATHDKEAEAVKDPSSEPKWPSSGGKSSDKRINGIDYEASFSIQKTPQTE